MHSTEVLQLQTFRALRSSTVTSLFGSTDTFPLRKTKHACCLLLDRSFIYLGWFSVGTWEVWVRPLTLGSPLGFGTWCSATRLTQTHTQVKTTGEGEVSVSKLTPQGWAFYADIIGSPPTRPHYELGGRSLLMWVLHFGLFKHVCFVCVQMWWLTSSTKCLNMMALFSVQMWWLTCSTKEFRSVPTSSTTFHAS